MASTESTARRYAQALFELGVEHDKLTQLGEQLDGVVDAFEKSEVFRHALMNPGVDLDERRQVIRTLSEEWGLTEMLLNFLLVLNDNDRLNLLPDIGRTYGKLVDKKEGNVRATVTSASTLDMSQRRSIEQALENMTGKNVILETDVDESLIGGAVARVGGTVYDGSVRNQLDRLRDKILEEV